MGTWAGLSNKPEEPNTGGPSSSTTDYQGAVRQGLKRMGTWGFSKGGDKDGARDGKEKVDDEEDDKHIRFMIGGSGRRLTKEDFLREIQSLDPKTRYDVVNESDAPLSMKMMARKDASKSIPGENRLLHAQDAYMATDSSTAKAVGAKTAHDRGAQAEDPSDDSGSSKSTKHLASLRPGSSSKLASSALLHVDSSSSHIEESAAERKRREQALKGVDDITPAQRGRSRDRSQNTEDALEIEETPAEKRRRLAVLRSVGNDEDSDDDDTPRVPPPVAKSRGIRFAQSPVRGRK
jgi:hypothetical protein